MAFPVVASAATSNSTVPGKPSGLAVGDIIVLMLSAVAYVNTNASVSAPDGTWTAVATSITSTNAGGIWYKVATAAEVAASTFGAMTGDEKCGSTLRITGADPTTPVILSNSAVVTSASLLCPGITPVLQSLLLNMAVGGNNNNTGAAATAQAIVNSNPSWTTIGSAISGIASNMSCNAIAAWANETGAPNTSTGNATATLSNNSRAVIAIMSIQPVVYTSDFFGSLFGSFAPTIPTVITAFLSATFGVFQPTTSAVAALWKTLRKSATSVFTNTTKL